MKVDEKMISEISSIMKLKFSSEETMELVQEINETLNMLATLQEVDTKDVDGTFYGAVNYENRFRKDEPIQDKDESKHYLIMQLTVKKIKLKYQLFRWWEGGA